MGPRSMMIGKDIEALVGLDELPCKLSTIGVFSSHIIILTLTICFVLNVFVCLCDFNIVGFL